VNRTETRRTEKSAVEKAMFWLFIGGAIVVVFHEIWPSMFLSALGQMVYGLGQLSGLCLFVWLVLMARRLQRG
jgi:hypothetical protein